MGLPSDPSDVKVYTVNGPPAGTSSSLPDWLTRKRAASKGKSKRANREHVEGTIELIQGFEFPEASNRIKTTRDGHHAIATGTYKPQIKVWDLDQLTLKFERHSDTENVDFIVLSDDWTKSMHLQNDRTIDLHTQGGFHYRTRIPKFGRSLAYHFPSCDALFSASGNEIYRLNLDQGRFMNPLVLDGDNILGVNIIDINPAHQLLGFGIDGNGTVQFWDPRSRSSVGVLSLPRSRLIPSTQPNAAETDLSVTAISSRTDGLSYAIGTSTGHTLLYDIRSPRPFAIKDQGYGLPVKQLHWIEGGNRMAGDGMVLSADKKVIKIWDRNAPAANFVSITPANDLNHVHHVPGTGLLMTANEGIQMCTYYIPQLGPAPRWASFLENITEEMENQTTRTVYEDYKFVSREELRTLGLDHLVGTPALKPYMHGYFVSLKLYDTARVIANPFAYAEYREKMVQEKMDKMAETRIRTKDSGVKVNKALAAKILRDEQRERKREERKRLKQGVKESEDVEMHDRETESSTVQKPNLLNDPRFAQLFEHPDFQVDEDSREFALMNPSAISQKGSKGEAGSRSRTKTVVEEEDESSKASSDGLSDDDNESSDNEGSDSSSADDLHQPRAWQKIQHTKESSRKKKQANRLANVNLVPMRAKGMPNATHANKDATFGQRLSSTKKVHERVQVPTSTSGDVGMEMSWIPSSGQVDEDDRLMSDERKKGKSRTTRKGVEVFGAGMGRGIEEQSTTVNESERKGRTERRKNVRSGSKNVFRGIK